MKNAFARLSYLLAPLTLFASSWQQLFYSQSSAVHLCYYQSLVHPCVDRADGMLQRPCARGQATGLQGGESCYPVSSEVESWIESCSNEPSLFAELPHFTQGQDRQRLLKNLCIYKDASENAGLNPCSLKLQLERFL